MVLFFNNFKLFFLLTFKYFNDNPQITDLKKLWHAQNDMELFLKAYFWFVWKR